MAAMAMRDYECGIIAVAYGVPALAAFQNCLQGIRSQRQSKRWHVTLLSPSQFAGVDQVISAIPDTDPGARMAKLQIDRVTPYRYTLYLDADTIPLGDLSAGFQLLADGWDLVIVPSVQQGDNNLFWHVEPGEREYTFEQVGYSPVQLQGGVFYFADNARVHDFFYEWRKEWIIYQDQDQAAMIRALHKAPLKVWLLGQPYNNGAVIAHRFGTARREQ